MPGRSEARRQRVRIGQRPDALYAIQFDARHGRHAVAGAEGEHQVIEGQGRAASQVDPTLIAIDCSDAIMDAKRRAEERRHEVAGVEVKVSRVKAA